MLKCGGSPSALCASQEAVPSAVGTDRTEEEDQSCPKADSVGPRVTLGAFFNCLESRQLQPKATTTHYHHQPCED